MYGTPLGARRPHPGGHWLKTLHDLGRTHIWWVETDASEESEDAVIGQFAEGVAVTDRGTLPADSPVLPWALLETATGERRETGITNPFGEDDAATTSGARTGAPAKKPASITHHSTVLLPDRWMKLTCGGVQSGIDPLGVSVTNGRALAPKVLSSISFGEFENRVHV